MAFNGVQPSSGPFSLSVGDSVDVWISRGSGDGDDDGAQWIMANPIGNSPGELQVTNFRKGRYLNDDGRSTHVLYLATVTATGDGGSGLGVVLFNLQGGGNT